eukprot:9819019-Alexandrium_andersonii.AAC.1
MNRRARTVAAVSGPERRERGPQPLGMQRGRQRSRARRRMAAARRAMRRGSWQPAVTPRQVVGGE